MLDSPNLSNSGLNINSCRITIGSNRDSDQAPNSFLIPVSDCNKDDIMRNAPDEKSASNSLERTPDSTLIHHVVTHLRACVGADLTHYKADHLAQCIRARIEALSCTSEAGYPAFLEQEPEECHFLLQRILVGSTRFFRDPPVWEAIEQVVLRGIAHRPLTGEPVRIWVAGCSTGEEAYTLAMVATLCGAHDPDARPLRIFATDMNPEALSFARRGVYPARIAGDIPPSIQSSFFNAQADGSLTIPDRIRNMVLFFKHCLTEDPPLHRMDLILCRNVLLYMDPALQSNVLARFSYALQRDGFLCLGHSERLEDRQGGFVPVCAEANLFQARHPGSLPVSSERSLVTPHQRQAIHETHANHVSERIRVGGGVDEVWRAFLETQLPPVVLVDENYECLFSAGAFAAWVREGDAGIQDGIQRGMRIQTLLLPDLVPPVGKLLHKAATGERRVIQDPVPYRDADGTPRQMRLEVLTIPVRRSGVQVYAVLFGGVAVPAPMPPPPSANMPTGRQEEDNTETTRAQEAHVSSLARQGEVLLRESMRRGARYTRLDERQESLHIHHEELASIQKQHDGAMRCVEGDLAFTEAILAQEAIGVLLLDAHLRIRWFSESLGGYVPLDASHVGRPFAHVRQYFRPIPLYIHVIDAKREARSIHVVWQKGAGTRPTTDVRILPMEGGARGMALVFRPTEPQHRPDQDGGRQEASTQAVAQGRDVAARNPVSPWRADAERSTPHA